MDGFTGIIDGINSVLWGSGDWPVPMRAGIVGALLLATGVYVTLSLKVIQIRKFPQFWKVLFHSFKPEHTGGISPFEAFATSLAARVGAGNISGVALAIILGGPGAVFWMWMVALIGMATAMVEATLAQVYKHRDEAEGANLFRGGPAYYMQKGLNARWMGILFSIFLIIAFPFIFNAVQSNTLAGAMNNAFSVPPLLTCVVVTVATGIIIFGGVRRIARFAELVVPFMALAYLAVGLAVLIMNFSALPETLALIVKSAFGPQELAGGVAGYAWASALSQGVNRGLFSNEAGLGSAPNAAATADIRHPASQGYVQAVGVFIDTIVVCTVTAMIILLSNPWSSIDENSEGVKLTQDSLSNEVGSWGAQFIAIALIFFTFTSIVACYYYGETSLLFMKDDHRLVTVMRILVMAIVAWGAVAKAQLVWDISNVALGLMALVNLVALLLLSRKGFAVIRDYEKQAKSGIDPQFHRDDFPDLDNHIEPDVWVPDRAEPKPA